MSGIYRLEQIGMGGVGWSVSRGREKKTCAFFLIGQRGMVVHQAKMQPGWGFCNFGNFLNFSSDFSKTLHEPSFACV